ncbi:hypothetical protein [Rhizobium rhizogenes]|uniref:hypothetical protein n=1 Tax=Rhizobium rhizogenes TaxID=359 RepID=UPI001574CDAD|nr:hypothetical protein [Rhizobium rhizogenes]
MEIDRRLPDTARPKALKAQKLSFVHDWADINGWTSEDKKEREWQWLDPSKLKLRPIDVSIWEKASELVALVQVENDRKCLLRWSMAQAGGKPFAAWCRSENIHVETGRRRKFRAIESILVALGCKPLQHNDNRRRVVLPSDGEMRDKDVIITNDAPNYWRAPDARPMACDFDQGLQNFEWVNAQNERRRQRDAEKRKQRAA